MRVSIGPASANANTSATASKATKKGKVGVAKKRSPKALASSQVKPKDEPKETSVKKRTPKQRKSPKSATKLSNTPLASPALSPPVLSLPASLSVPSCPSSTASIQSSQEQLNNYSAFSFNSSSSQKPMVAASSISLLETLSSVVAHIPLPDGISNNHSNDKQQPSKQKRPRKPKQQKEPNPKKSVKKELNSRLSESLAASAGNSLNASVDEQYKFTDSSPEKNESVLKGYQSKKSAKRKMPSLSNEVETTPKSKKKKLNPDEAGNSSPNKTPKQKRASKSKQVKLEPAPTGISVSEGILEIKSDNLELSNTPDDTAVDKKVLKSPKKPRKKKGEAGTEATSESAANGIAKKSKVSKKKNKKPSPASFGGMKLDISSILDNGGNPDVVALAVSNLTGAMNGGLRKKPKKKKSSLEETNVSIKSEEKSKPSSRKRKPNSKQPESGESQDTKTLNLSGVSEYENIIEQVARGTPNENNSSVVNGNINNPVSTAGIIMQGVSSH